MPDLDGIQPWMVLVTLVLILIIGIGMRLLAKSSGRDKWIPNWNRDPDEMQDLSPSLQRARRQMALAVIGMLTLLAVGLMTWLQGE